MVEMMVFVGEKIIDGFAAALISMSANEAAGLVKGDDLSLLRLKHIGAAANEVIRGHPCSWVFAKVAIDADSSFLNKAISFAAREFRAGSDKFVEAGFAHSIRKERETKKRNRGVPLFIKRKDCSEKELTLSLGLG